MKSQRLISCIYVSHFWINKLYEVLILINFLPSFVYCGIEKLLRGLVAVFTIATFFIPILV